MILDLIKQFREELNKITLRELVDNHNLQQELISIQILINDFIMMIAPSKRSMALKFPSLNIGVDEK